MKAIFKDFCPNCNGEIDDERLWHKVPCEKCLPLSLDKVKKLSENLSNLEFKELIYELLNERGTLKNYSKIYELERRVEEVNKIFEACIGSSLWSAQKVWVKRILNKVSFALISPTGMGKTTFGMVMSLYLAKHGKKCYIILPTTILVKQINDRLEEFMEKSGVRVRVLAYHTELKKGEKEEVKEKITKGEFDILVTSSQFLARNFEIIKKQRFYFIFVDDVDAFLKASKNIDRVLFLMGFSEDAIKAAMEIIKIKKQLVVRRDKNLEDKLKTLERSLEEFKDVESILVVSSATGKVKGDKVKVFRELLNFEVGTAREGARNIEHIWLEGKLEDICEIIRKMGGGCLIFVPIDAGTELAKEIEQFLISKGINAKAVHAKTKKSVIDRFAKGEIDALIGVASYYGVIVRGLDIPERVRYAIFYGIPKFKFSLEIKERNPIRVLSLLSTLREFSSNKERVDRMIIKLRRILSKLSPEDLRKVEESQQLNDFLVYVKQEFEKAAEFLQNMLKNKEVLDKIGKSPYISLVKESEGLFIKIPDVRTYIQATGRTSRMYAGGITKGASFVFIDDEKVFNGLKRQLILLDEEFKSIGEVDLKKIKEEIERDRKLLTEIREGKVKVEAKEPVKSCLFIVESPNKAKTIANFFGRPSKRRIGELVAYETHTGDFALTIIATGGHILDLAHDGIYGVKRVNGKFIPIYTTIKKCRKCNEQFVEGDVCPNKKCNSKDIFDSRYTIEALRHLADEIGYVIVGTDADSEGEKIAWDVATLIAPFAKEIKRAEFHEVTRRAILNALENPREIDEFRVNAQIVRRIEDRWIGFYLSQDLWRIFEKGWLSAGRVQTPVLGWVIEFEKLARKKKSVVRIVLENDAVVDFEFKNIRQAKKFAEDVEEAYVEILEEKEEKIKPNPPYTTDTLLRDASRFFRLDAPKVMQIAQDLFEAGLCLTPDTYVIMHDGSIKKIGDISENENVLGLNNLHEMPAKVLRFWKIPYKGVIKEIVLENNYSIKATPDHGIFVYRDGKFGWVSAKNVRVGDYVAVAFNVNIKRESLGLLELLAKLGILDICVEFKKDSKLFEKLKKRVDGSKASAKYKYMGSRAIPLKYLDKWGIDLKAVEREATTISKQRSSAEKIPIFKLNSDFWYFVGLVMGGGTIEEEKIVISQKDAKEIKRILENVFPFANVRIAGTQVYLANSIIAEILRKLDVRGKLNGLVFSLPEDCINAMIAGYIDADDSISLKFDKKCCKNNLRIVISNKEREKIEKIGYYLCLIGILNTLHKDEKTGIWKLILGNKSLKTFKKKIGKHLRTRRKIFEKAYKACASEHLESDFVPFSKFFKLLKFGKGVEGRILKELCTDARNLDDCACIQREKLKKVVKFAEDTDVKTFLLELLNANVSWVRVKEVRNRQYNGYVYDITTATSNFFANAILNHNCTYHRTDSTRVSKEGLNVARELVEESFGKEYFKARIWYMEGAHECIRPTKPLTREYLEELINTGALTLPRQLTFWHLVVYELIVNRFMASQMREARVVKQKVKVSVKDVEKEVEGYAKVVDESFLKITKVPMIPEFRNGRVKVKDVKVMRVPSSKLLTQADLVALMKERGIGRPSTYATIIAKLFKRGYLYELGKEKRINKIVARKIGKEVFQYLISNYPHLISEERTRKLEEDMDMIEEGKKDYQEVLNEIYKEIFEPEILKQY